MTAKELAQPTASLHLLLSLLLHTKQAGLKCLTYNLSSPNTSDLNKGALHELISESTFIGVHQSFCQS
jgi:hypothetical protein